MQIRNAATSFMLTMCLVLGVGSLASAQLRLGVVGGSLHDENRGVINFPAVGWNEQLAEAGIVDMGVYEPDPYVRWEPQYDGYSFNWARGGASAMSPTFRDLLPDDPRFVDMVPFAVQIEGLAQQIQDGDIDVAFIGVGANDITIRLLLGGTLSGPDFEAFAAQLVDAIFVAVTAFKQAGDVPIMVAQLPAAIYQNDERAAATAFINSLIHARAEEEGVPVVALFGFLDNPFRTNRDGDVRVGRFRIPSDSVASPDDLVPVDAEEATGPCGLISEMCSTREFNLNFLLDDAVHPTTVIHGLMANQVIKTLRRAYHIPLRRLTDREILSTAGLTCHGW